MMSICKLKNIIVALFVICIAHTTSVKGSVYDSKTNEPLVGASVFIEGTSYGTASDIDGSYSINIPNPNKTYIIKSTYIGYLEFSKEIEFIDDNDIYLDISLESSSVDVDETTVTAQRRQDKITESPAAVEIVSAGDIKREESTNLGSYLKGIKGVDFTSSGINNYSISVRGFNSSFTSRLLTLTDGRVASTPALRAVIYSTVPQSSKDIENIEIVLGPSTALYGANAHSGVVNITSKSPADSEGLDVSISRSINDNRNLQKISSRWASKLTKKLSMKVSGMYLQGNEWEFISEQEYKLHKYPYSGTPARVRDGKDNNPWRDDYSALKYEETNDGRYVRIGDGESFATDDVRYDPDGDGVAGEDWFNGFDDDLDGLIDEDYFESDGVDNDGDCNSDSNFDGCYCCGWFDENNNKIWDEGESPYGDENVDEFIDVNEDMWFDGVDNDGNGLVDDSNEQFTGAQPFPNWSTYIEDNQILVFNGRKNKYNAPEYFEDFGIDGISALGSTEEEFYEDINNNGIYDEGYDIWNDCGIDGICPGDPNWTAQDVGEGDGVFNVAMDEGEFNGVWDEGELFYDANGDGTWTSNELNPWYIEGNDAIGNYHIRGNHIYDEELVELLFDVFTYDFGDDGRAGDYTWYDENTGNHYGFIDGTGNGEFEPWEGGNTLFGGNLIPSEGWSEPPFGPNANGVPDPSEIGENWNTAYDNGLDGLPNTGDYGEGDGVWNSFDWNGNGSHDDGDTWDSSEWNPAENTGIPNNYDDIYPLGNNIYNPNDPGDILLDCGQDGLCEGDIGWSYADLGEGNGILGVDSGEADGVFDTGDGCFGCEAEYFYDSNNNGLLDDEELGTWVDDNLGKQGVLTESQCNYIGGFFYDNDQDGVGYCGDGSYTSADYKDNFQTVDDINGDGLSDYPDFEVKNGKAEIRLDYDPNKDTNISFQSGYSWSKLQQITGIGRFIADGYEYSYYQLRGRYKNMFAQVYLNQGDTGETRGYDLGNVIRDVSENVAFQFQHNFDLPKINTNIVWGIDMFTTTSKTNGSVLNDGPNGYDNDGDQWFLSADDLDNDFDSNDFADCGQDGQCEYVWQVINGIDTLVENEFYPGYADFGEGNGLPDVGEPGVDNQGYVYADGIDNDGDSFDPDNDGYPTFQEIYAGTDPNDGNSYPQFDTDNDGIFDNNAPIANSSWAVDEMIDENWCTQDGYYQEYAGFVPPDKYSGTRDGKVWECNEGIDEPDEFIDVASFEKGFYVQSKSKFNSYNFLPGKWELVTALRLDEHDKLDEGTQVAPKFGLFYKPTDAHTFRFTYGKAFNTPSAITLYTDLFIRRLGPLQFFLRGNIDGTPYERVGDNGSINVSPPQMYIDGNLEYIGEGGNAEYWSGQNSNGEFSNYNAPYTERVVGAPYFLSFNTGFLNVPDYIPLDTALYTVYVPELGSGNATGTGTGRVYTPLEALNTPDVDPIKTEKIQTIELGFKGFLSERIHASVDYYASFYEDFFSAPTIITPTIVHRDPNNYTTSVEFAQENIVGLLPLNYNAGNAPFGTQWDGIDNDNDWSSQTTLPFFANDRSFNINPDNATTVYGGYMNIDFTNPIYNTTNSNGDPAFDWSAADGFGWSLQGEGSTPGQWGLVDYIICGDGVWDGLDSQPTGCNGLAFGDTLGLTIYQPEDVVNTEQVLETGIIDFPVGDGSDFWVPVGIDEYSPIAGLSEAEIIESPIIGANGEPLSGPGTAFTPLHSILAPMNYGEVTMQGIDLGIAYLLPEYKLSFDANFSFYNSTEYYNSLTKKNDPINAPKFKMNAGVNWGSPLGNIALKYRHVDKFAWSDGIWSGTIGPYDLFDLLYSVKLGNHLELNMTGQNIFDYKHKQIIGGAFMGRQIIMRLTASL